MKKVLVLLALLAAPAAFGGRLTTGRQPFPDDYKPHPCAPADPCGAVSPTDILQLATTLRGYPLRLEWVDAHWKEMMELIRPTCAKTATCYATAGNTAVFCMDLLFHEFWGVCDRYPADSEMAEQCSLFMRIYAFRADLRDKQIWKQAQACAAQQAPKTETPRRMDVWISPKKIGDDYEGKFVVYALDPETKVPIQALVSMPNTRLGARSEGGKPWTNYEIKWPITFLRVPNADGHTDLVPPEITVTADGYETVTMKMPVEAGQAIIETTPALNTLQPGRHTVTFNARDARTGKPVELRVMLGETTILGNTNQPVQVEIRKREKRPEIWATSLFHRYHDIVIAPAEK
jgi:hypothetical protein